MTGREATFWERLPAPPRVTVRVGDYYLHTGWCPRQRRVQAMRNGETGLTIWLPPFMLDVGREWRPAKTSSARETT